ncbi:MAG TPA: PLD nuclease N-terminal domain-containing protein [Actinomycetota bacterium]|nr:PLD nuclease N-terminal domain-containing protein [Actinomycetota bacterium]
MPYFGGLFSLAMLALWIYCLIDAIQTDEALVRNLNKMIWIILIILVPVVGSIAWLVAGRPENAPFPGAESFPRSTSARRRGITPRAPLGPEDSPEFMSGLDERTEQLKRWEDDLKRREDELRRREEE